MFFLLEDHIGFIVILLLHVYTSYVSAPNQLLPSFSTRPPPELALQELLFSVVVVISPTPTDRTRFGPSLLPPICIYGSQFSSHSICCLDLGRLLAVPVISSDKYFKLCHSTHSWIVIYMHICPD